MDRTASSTTIAHQTQVGVRVQSKVEIAPAGRVVRKHYTEVPAAEWDWEHLRDYSVDQIIRLHGPFPRRAFTEDAVFKRFHGEWGADAPRIARYAFEISGGRWGGSPISVNRFCKESDPYFARPIADKIHGRA
jgi:hypothetical protein